MTIYAGSDGRYYTERDLWLKLENREWTVVGWEAKNGREVVETEQGEELSLQPLGTARNGQEVDHL